MLLPRTFVLFSLRRGLSSMAYQMQTANAVSSASEVDIVSYLLDVEAAVRSQGPIMTKKLSEPNQKPMIRTLLGIDEKTTFDSVVRAAKKETEYVRLESFVKNQLSPAIAKDNRLDKVPDMPDIIADALEQPPSSGAGAFRKLGTGRIYRGNTREMVSDIAPEILPSYLEASKELTDMEAMTTVIESCRTTVSKDRIDAAMRCLEDFPMRDDYDNTTTEDDEEDDAKWPKFNGKECERSCIEYLEALLAEDEIIIPNVYVNHKSAMSRPKYQKGNSFRNNGVDTSAGIIWTSFERANSCSEFDALIYAENEGGDVAQIKEIWEAKFSISPSTLWDAVTKKASAVREIMDDDGACLSHESRQMRISTRSGDGDGDEEEKLIFGIFGKDLLSPQNAIGQMVSMATANALSKDVDTVLTALDRGYVEVKQEKALDDLDVLRKQLRQTEKDFHIRLSIG